MLLFSLTDEEQIIQTIVSLLKQSGDQLEEKVTPPFFRSYTCWSVRLHFSWEWMFCNLVLSVSMLNFSSHIWGFLKPSPFILKSFLRLAVISVAVWEEGNRNLMYFKEESLASFLLSFMRCWALNWLWGTLLFTLNWAFKLFTVKREKLYSFESCCREINLLSTFWKPSQKL